jgi:hypothetical protein
MKTINVCLIVICILEILFVGVCFVASWQDILIPSALITYWHVTFVAELFSCAGIKISKVWHNHVEDDIIDDEDAVG